jgi:DNA ligase 1
MQSRPLLAATAPPDLDELRYPLLCSPKLDGIRCLISNGVAYSRKLKPFPNRHIQHMLSSLNYHGLDGEIIVGAPTDPNCMQRTMSAVMSRDGEPDFQFYVFDFWLRGSRPYDSVLSQLSQQRSALINPLEQWPIHSSIQLEEYEQEKLSLGYEGVIARLPAAPYKNGRSTLKQQYLLKIKRFVDEEAVIIGTKELMHNANEAELDERGYTKRSTHQANKIPAGKLGALVCQLPNGETFDIGTGFDEYDRHAFWRNRESLIGQLVTFKHFKQCGVVDKPRFPVFKSLRDGRDV